MGLLDPLWVLRVNFNNIPGLSDVSGDYYQLVEFCPGAVRPSYKKSNDNNYIWPSPFDGDSSWYFGYNKCTASTYVIFASDKNDGSSKFWEGNLPTFSYVADGIPGFVDTDSVNTYGLADAMAAGYQLGDENLSYYIFRQADGTWGVSSEIDGILEETLGTRSCVVGIFGDIEISNDLGNAINCVSSTTNAPSTVVARNFQNILVVENDVNTLRYFLRNKIFLRQAFSGFVRNCCISTPTTTTMTTTAEMVTTTMTTGGGCEFEMNMFCANH